MIVKISKELSNVLERLHCSLSKPEIENKISSFINLCSSEISNCSSKMGLDGKFDEVLLDISANPKKCIGLSADKKQVIIYFENIEDSREINYSIIHCLGHAEDIFKNNFDYERFIKISQAEVVRAFFVWDVFVDSRLSRKVYYSYFQARGFYYDYKMKYRNYSFKNPEESDEVFESLWNRTTYSIDDVEEIFEKIKR
jgi:hypothetical protein